MKRALLIIYILCFLGPLTAEAGMPPDQLVKTTTQKIIQLLKKNKKVYEHDHRKLFDMVNEIVLPHFDFVVMSKWVLGRKHWSNATADQRRRFVSAFKELLVRTYAIALLKYTDEKVIYLPFDMRPGVRRTTVRVEIQRSGGGENVPMAYSFYNKRSDWKIYDVKISGISLATNYRAEYDARIRREGMDALIEGIEKKNQAMRDGKSGNK